MVIYEYDEFEFIGEESEEDLKIQDINRFSESVIWGTDWTTETVISQLKKGNIDLSPKFQRRDAWGEDEKSRLIESLILGMPVPPIILAELKEQRNKYIVIDGKQRLLSLRQFAADISNDKFKKLKLKGLQFLNILNGYVMEQIEDDYSLNPWLRQFENQTIRTVVIKNWPNEQFLYAVFLRLNTGSKKLSPQELRQALHPGEFLNFLDDKTSESKYFFNILRNQEADSRMRDVELALRFFAFKYFIGDYRGNLKDFLDDTCRKLNNIWVEKEDDIKADFYRLERAISISFDIFGNRNAFTRFKNGKYSGRFNRALFEPFTYFLSNDNIRNKLNDGSRREIIRLSFEDLSNNDDEFNESVASSTKDIHRTCTRFNRIAQIIGKAIDESIPLLDVVEGSTTIRGE